MRVVARDLKHGRLKLASETLDDLWHLYNLIEPGDLVGSLTARREEGASDKIRPDRGEKRKMFLTLRAENVEFHEFSDRLRVLGVIVAGPQDLGSHHTFNLESDDTVEITKTRWPRHHMERIDEAVKCANRPLMLVLALEDDSATLGVLHHYGIRVAAQIGGRSGGKQYKEANAGKDFFESVLDVLRHERQDGKPLVVIGPGFTKEEFVKFVRDREPELVKGAVIEGTGQAGTTGIHEALKSGSVTRALGDQRVAREVQAVEELLVGISKNGPVTYGPKHVKKALNRSAVERLLISDKLVRKGEAESYLESCRNQGGESIIISSVHEGGKKLEGLGGIGAFLRYKL